MLAVGFDLSAINPSIVQLELNLDYHFGPNQGPALSGVLGVFPFGHVGEFFPSTMWVQGIKLRPSGLTAVPFPA